MKNQFIKALLVLLASVPTFALAQKGIVRGQVIEEETGDALFSANVIIKGTQNGTTTDFDGKFELSAEPGTYNVEVSFIGLSSTTISGVQVKAGDVTVLDGILLKPASSELGVVTVTAEAVRNTETAILVEKKKSANIFDGISAAKLRKTGDSDAGDAAKRVTGVTVEGGKYVYVRGLGDRYTKTTLNGADIPGLDPDRNAIQIDIFPTNLIDNMTILKAGSAEFPADWSGGIVNIETKDFPDRQSLSASIGLGYNPSMHFNSNYIQYEGGATDFLGFDDGTRELPAGAESAIIPLPQSTQGFTDQDVNNFVNSFSPTLGAMKQSSLLDASIGISAGNQKMLENGNKLGYIFAVTYKNSTKYYDEAIYGDYQRATNSDENELVASTIREGEQGENNVLLGGLAGIAYKTFKSKYRFTVMHLQNAETKSGQFDVTNYSAAVGQSGYRAYSNSLYYGQRGLTNILLNGEHHSEDDKWTVDWRVSPTISSISEPDLRTTNFTIRRSNGALVFNSGDGGLPERIWRSLDEINVVGKIDVTREFNWLERDAKFKFGASHVYKDRNYNILSYEMRFNGEQPNFTGDPNEVLVPGNIYPNGGGIYYASGNADPNPNQYSSNLHNTGAYASIETQPLYRLKVILGLRAENFVQFHTGRNQQGTRVLDNDEVLSSLDLFPSANVIYNLTDNQNLRFSYFRSIARPSFKELSFAQILDPISDRTFNGGLIPYGEVWDGNLSETRINNFDVRWELYGDRGELFSVSAFAKFFNDAIELVRIPEAQTTAEFQPRNVGNGQVFGAEVELRKNLSFISEALDKFSFSGNFTYVYSQIDMTSTEFNARKDREKIGENIEDTRAMAGQAPYVVNAGIVYDNSQKQFSAGAYYNVKGRTLEVVGGRLFPDVYTELFHSLNLTASKSFGKEGKQSINLKVENVLNDIKESFYVGYGAHDQIFTSLNPGTAFSISYTYKFK